MGLSIVEFQKKFGTDDQCLEYLFQVKISSLGCCPQCGVVNAQFKRVKRRRCYQCCECRGQTYPTAGTPFEKSKTPLSTWFLTFFLFMKSKNGISAKYIQRFTGVTYKTAWKMGHAIRRAMKSPIAEVLNGIVEIDETYIGGRTPRRRGRNTVEKAPVFAMVERYGRAVAFHVPNTQMFTVLPIIKRHVDKGARTMTDEANIYKRLESLGYAHETVLHDMYQYAYGDVTTNSVEGFFSGLKRMLKGTHIQVSKKYLQNYLDQYTYMYSCRNLGVDVGALLANMFASVHAT